MRFCGDPCQREQKSNLCPLILSNSFSRVRRMFAIFYKKCTLEAQAQRYAAVQCANGVGLVVKRVMRR